MLTLLIALGIMILACIAILIFPPKKIQCDHEWEDKTKELYPLKYPNTIRVETFRQCSNCGEIENKE
jgi:hypothetical protein